MSEERSTEFMHLLTQHDRALTMYVYGLIGGSADADDILQLTKMVMWRSYEQFEKGSNFIAWARKIAFNQILMFRRKQKREHSPLSDEMLERVGEEIMRLSDHAAQRREALYLCMRRLPEQQRQLLELRYFEEREIDDIAQLTQSTPAAVYRALSRIRYTLLTCVQHNLKNSTEEPYGTHS